MRKIYRKEHFFESLKKLSAVLHMNFYKMRGPSPYRHKPSALNMFKRMQNGFAQPYSEVTYPIY